MREARQILAPAVITNPFCDMAIRQSGDISRTY
jgi:hypothetical protein